jgi:pimeloyl-ACP methyl ester carboxylesterase
VDRFAVAGHSGGGTHALACAALLPERVSAVVAVGSIGPFEADGLDWWTGMVAPEELQAAVAGRRRLAELLATDSFDPESFTESDHAAVRGTWLALGRNAGLATANGFDGQIDDDLAYVRPWGFPAAQVRARTLLVHGTADRIAPLAHSEWLAKHCAAAELRTLPEAGHISVLDGAPAALDWLANVTGATP